MPGATESRSRGPHNARCRGGGMATMPPSREAVFRAAPESACMRFLPRAWRSALAVLPAATPCRCRWSACPSSLRPPNGDDAAVVRGGFPGRVGTRLHAILATRMELCASGVARRERHADVAGPRARVVRGRAMATMPPSREAALGAAPRTRLHALLTTRSDSQPPTRCANSPRCHMAMIDAHRDKHFEIRNVSHPDRGNIAMTKHSAQTAR